LPRSRLFFELGFHVVRIGTGLRRLALRELECFPAGGELLAEQCDVRRRRRRIRRQTRDKQSFANRQVPPRHPQVWGWP